VTGGEPQARLNIAVYIRPEEHEEVLTTDSRRVWAPVSLHLGTGQKSQHLGHRGESLLLEDTPCVSRALLMLGTHCALVPTLPAHNHTPPPP